MSDSEPTPSPPAGSANAPMTERARHTLPVIARPRTPMRVYLVHALRVCVLLTILWLIHDQHRIYQKQQAYRDAAAVKLDAVLPFFPTAAAITTWNRRHGGRVVTDAQGEPLGFFLQTSPDSDQVLGYSGPTNTLIAFNQQNKIVGTTVLSSGDTPEHVADVLRDRRFLSSFVGRTWDEAAEMPDPDGVTGATLTSMAISEGIRRRLGGTRPSLRFPNPITVDELSTTFPQATSIEPRPGYRAITDVLNRQGRRIGALIRTSPTTDSMHGYQGPTDTLVVLDASDRVSTLLLRSSFDNEPYVSYVRDDSYFPTIFQGKTLRELAEFDVVAAEVEGVSGATMTSISVAATLPETARRALAPDQERRATNHWTARDIGTSVMILCAMLLCFTRLRRQRQLRIAFQIILIVYLGFLNSDFVSQTLLVGWARSGIPFGTAGGLALLTISALLIPIFTKRNIYCSHLCPFGAIQQLARKTPAPRIAIPRGVTRVLAGLPALLLAIVVATAMGHLPINLAALEPFDAFVFQVAGWASIGLALLGFVAAFFIPMAYCRFGCPTGTLLQFVRLHARSDRLGTRDLVAIALLLLAVGMRALSL